MSEMMNWDISHTPEPYIQVVYLLDRLPTHKLMAMEARFSYRAEFDGMAQLYSVPAAWEAIRDEIARRALAEDGLRGLS